MSALRPPHINDVMIAAADLEDAEFQRDRLAIACGEAIRQALDAGLSYAQIAGAANLHEGEVRRLAEAPAPVEGLLGDPVAQAVSVLAQEEALITFDPTLASGVQRADSRTHIDLSGAVGQEPGAS